MKWSDGDNKNEFKSITITPNKIEICSNPKSRKYSAKSIKRSSTNIKSYSNWLSLRCKSSGKKELTINSKNKLFCVIQF